MRRRLATICFALATVLLGASVSGAYWQSRQQYVTNGTPPATLNFSTAAVFPGAGSVPTTLISGASIGSAYATRRLIFTMQLPAANASDSNYVPTSILLGGVESISTMVRYKGSGFTGASAQSQIVYSWADVPSGTTADVAVTWNTVPSFVANGSMALYYFDSANLVNGSPSTDSSITVAGTSVQTTVNTSADGFIIVNYMPDTLAYGTSPGITSSTETYTTDYNSGAQEGRISSLLSGSSASTPSQTTWGWTNTKNAIAATLAWR